MAFIITAFRLIKGHMVNCLPIMSLQFESIHRVVIKGLRITGIPLPWVDKGSKNINILNDLYNYLIITIVLYQFVFALHTAVNIDDFEEKCRLGVVLSIGANASMLTLYYILFKRRLKIFSENSNSLSNSIMEADLGNFDVFKETYLSAGRSSAKFTRYVLFLVLWSPVIYCAPSPIIDLFNGEYRSHLPLTIWYPYDDRSPGFYEMTFFLQTLATLYGDMKKFANDCFFLGVFRLHSVYFKYLSTSIRALGRDFKKSSDVVINRKLITWLKLHDHLIRNVSELISLYTPVICIYYANLICMVTLGIFTQIKHESGSLESIGLTAFCLVNLFQLYMQCSTNEEVGAEADNLATEIYNTPWYEISKTNKDILRLAQRMANRPVDITAFKAPTLRLNKESFLAFITSTITAVVAFSKMSELRQ